MDLDTALELLTSVNAGYRLQACEYFYSADETSPAIISALEVASRDRDRDVAAAAKKALARITSPAAEQGKVLLTTTPMIEGFKIETYIGIVSAEVVLGTGFLSEFGAGFADLLGSRAGKFQDKLKEAREITLAELKRKARALEANAIVGLDLDYSVLSNNMLMVVANGTAARVVPLPQPVTSP